MAAWIRDVARVARSQARSVGRAVLGQPVEQLTALVAQTLDGEDAALAKSWLRREREWTDGRRVADFERAFCAWNGSRYAAALDSGRVALSACIHALGLRPGDEALVPGYTCIVVANAFRFAGVTPVFCDIELETFGMAVADAERKLTEKTRAILVHHLFGLVARDYVPILELAERRGLKVIEDCAHATGASLAGVKVGNRGHAAFYSSEHSKAFSTFQGGVATANDQAIGRRLQEFAAAAPWPSERQIERQLLSFVIDYYQFRHPRRLWLADWARLRYRGPQYPTTSGEEVRGQKPPGYGSRMAAPFAALASRQIEKLDSYNAERRKTALRWNAWCEIKGVTKPLVLAGSEPIFLRYPVLVEPEKKRATSWARRELGVELGVWFKTHLHPSDERVGGCPNADEAVARCVNLPTLR
jgi:dTDP-4-amino-4,6-dideoxygalactose transaminase